MKIKRSSMWKNFLLHVENAKYIGFFFPKTTSISSLIRRI